LRTRLSRIVFVLLLVVGVAFAQKPVPYSQPLPQDQGQTGLAQQLKKLHTTARLLHTTAHPDDEDGGMLTLESRGQGVNTVLLTLTRGEGGQNRMGSGLFDALGSLRTLELLAADRYYGVEQRFSHVADFGFSKTPEETFEKWGGRDTALADMVRVIRTFRPDVIVSRFSGTASDGHGHHQASGLLTMEAFRAAADPKRFPEQIAAGLAPWQAKKLYIGTPFRDENPEYTVAIDKGQTDPNLGMSYQQFAMQGLRHQLSQGAGQWNLPSGPHISKYKLVDSTLDHKPAQREHEQGLFDGIDTSLPGLASRLGPEEGSVAWLRPELTAAATEIAKADATSPQTAVEPLLKAAAIIRGAIAKLQTAEISKSAKADVISQLQEKFEQANEAARLAAGLELKATIDRKDSAAMAGTIVPGDSFTVNVSLTGVFDLSSPLARENARALKVRSVQLVNVTSGSWLIERDGATRFRVKVPSDAEYTRPYFHRKNADRDAVYQVDDPRYSTLPMTPAPLKVKVEYEVNGQVGELTTTPVQEFTSDGQTLSRPLAVLPAVSVTVDPPTRVMPLSKRAPVEVHVQVRSNSDAVRDGLLQLRVPDGWQVEPVSQPVALEGRGAEHTYKFFLVRVDGNTSVAELRAILDENQKLYEQGVATVTRDDLGTAYYYQPAQARINLVDVKVLPNQVIGYLMGAGDDIPRVLEDLGVDVKMITPEELASGDLSKYSTIVLGIRAYDVREDVRKQNPRLLEYAKNGGTLLVQYNTDVAQFNAGNFTPYPAELGRDRVTVEDAPVRILEPQEDVFDFPNVITAHDFDGWVQERGLYFMKSWDARYLPLLESHDPGEPELKGGLLQTPYGKGWYLYCSYAFFRQLPNGVPGAARFFINLITAPNEWKH
jgi:LmbE family N-acetylglucosaminyl deacetylase